METVIRGAVVYLVLLVVLRLAGRRALSEMSAFDLVLVLICAETTQQALLAEDFSLTNAVVLIITLFTLDIGLSFVKAKLPATGKMLDGVPTLLVTNGIPDERALRRSRVDLNEVMQAATETQGIERLDQINFAVLEGSGKISIVPRQGH